jgi:hypothetical protein
VRDEITVSSTGSQESIDDETVAYILSAQRPFEDLRQVAAQLAGLLALAASGGKSATADHPLLETARRLHQSAAAEIQGLRRPGRASAHREHVSQASAALGRALACTQGYLGRSERGAEINTVLHPLQAACDQLRLAAGALPGFQMISFEQACCGPQISATAMAGDDRGAGRAK